MSANKGHKLCRKLFNATTADTQHVKLHNFMPTKRESGHDRSSKMYPLPKLSTQRFTLSFINCGLFITANKYYIIKDIFSIMPYKSFCIYVLYLVIIRVRIYVCNVFWGIQLKGCNKPFSLLSYIVLHNVDIHAPIHCSLDRMSHTTHTVDDLLHFSVAPTVLTCTLF